MWIYFPCVISLLTVLCAHGVFANCTDGFHGENCTTKCSQFCGDSKCDKMSGECESCVGIRVGLNCEECPDGFYDETCGTECSEFCEDNECDAHSGACLKCIDKRIGSYCEDCDPGTFGFECEEICPKLCSNKTCQNTTGECFSCIGSSTGPFCEEIMPETSTVKTEVSGNKMDWFYAWTNWLYLILPLLLIISICLVFLLPKERTPKNVAESDFQIE